MSLRRRENLVRHRLLFEIWRLRDLRGRLLESRLDFLQKQFMPRIVAALAANTLHIPLSMVDLNHMMNDDQAVNDAATAAHVFDLVLQADPDPVKKNTQWLLTQILRKTNPMPLEDLEGAAETLGRYAEMKRLRQIPADKADINVFKSLSELAALLRGEVQQQVMASDAEQADMFQESTVLLNDAQVMVLIPKTKKAACYWGRDTGWCTAWGDHLKLGLSRQGREPTRTSYFDHYANSGPLYIVHDKVDNTWWQLHFESGQFMDVNDRPFPMVTLVKKHPALFKAIGEEKFIRIAEQFGLSWFSPATISQFPDHELGDLIASKADLKLIPPAKLIEMPFVMAVMSKNGGEAVRWFPSRWVFEHAEELAVNFRPCFQFLPEVLQTEELANQVAHSASWESIEKNIPVALRSTAVNKKYWVNKAARDGRCTLAMVPEEFQSLCAVHCLERTLTDIPQFAGLLDEEMAVLIASHKPDAFGYLPERLFNQRLANVLQGAIDRKTYNHPDLKTYWARFDPQFWSPEAITWMIENGKMDFAKLPEQFRTPAHIATIVTKTPAEAKKIPAHYWTQAVLDATVTKYTLMLKYIDPANVPEDYLVALASKQGPYGNLEFGTQFYQNSLPETMKTPKVIAAFVATDAVAIKAIPKAMLTDDVIVRRLTDHGYETTDVPPDRITQAFAVRLAQANASTVHYIPPAVFSEPLLFAWLTKLADQNNPYRDGQHNPDYRGYGRRESGNQVDRKVFETFPKNLWSSRTLALAIDEGFVLPSKSLVPDGLMDRAVAGALIAKNHEDVNDLTDHLDDDAIAEALKHNWRLLETLPPEKLTEPMAFAVMEKFALRAKHGTYDYQTRTVPENPIGVALRAMPKKLWSKRVCAAAVGYVMPLKAVPAKWRDDAMIRKAVTRDPDNIRVLADPAAWLTAHLTNYTDGRWREKIESLGVAIVKNKYVNASSYPREMLPSGASYALVKAGKTNVRVYLFDKKNHFVLFLYTDKDTVKLPPEAQQKAAAYRADLLELTRRELGSYTLGELNDLGIYSQHGNVRSEEQSPKKTEFNMEWTRNEHGEGTMFVAWAKDKPVLRLQSTATAGGWGRSRGSSLSEITVINAPYCLAHSADIVDYLNGRIRADKRNPGALHDLGISYDKNGIADTIMRTKLGTVGTLTIWRNDRNIGLFTPAGMVASGVVRAKGNITDVVVNHRIDGGISQSIAAQFFAKISAVLAKDKTATGLKLAEMLRRFGQRL